MIYELRTYRVSEGRMSDILNRFETTAFGVFDRHGIEVIGFWTKKGANDLVYLCRFENEEAMQKAWDAFRADPEWIAAKARTEADGPLVSEVISETLSPTSFSPLA